MKVGTAELFDSAMEVQGLRLRGQHLISKLLSPFIHNSDAFIKFCCSVLF